VQPYACEQLRELYMYAHGQPIYIVGPFNASES